MRSLVLGFVLAALCFCLLMPLQLASEVRNPWGEPAVAKLYISPMGWNLDRFVAAEIARQQLPVRVVERQEDSDFVLLAAYENLGSRLISAGSYIRVRLVSTADGAQVWSGDANDYAMFFGRLRKHGPAKAAREITNKLRRVMPGLSPSRR